MLAAPATAEPPPHPLPYWMANLVLRIGTRGSALALWQAGWVADRLRGRSGAGVEIVRIESRGDRESGPLTPDVTGPGFFTSELEQALLRGEIDVAVHSLKDLPIEQGGGLEIAAVPVRHDPRDVLVARDGLDLASLPAGARVGTSSPRRASLVRSVRPDVEVVPLRGNVDTRVRSVGEGRNDAVVLAAAGVGRLGLEEHVTEWFDARAFPPAPGQGALAVQVRSSAEDVREVVALLEDAAARASVTAERALLAGLGGGCSMPVGAHAEANRDGVHLVGFAGSVDGRRVLRAESSGADPLAVGHAAAQELLDAGAAEVLG